MARPIVLFAGLSIALILTACEAHAPDVAQAPPPPVSSFSFGDDAPAAEQFAAIRTASDGTPTVYGAYNRGCIGGAKQLPLDAAHWQVLHPSRNRAWGHPSLVRFIEGLADGAAADGYRGLLVGDLAQPRGGPLPSDHNSHQVGLDADIWLTPLPAKKLNAEELESFEPPSMVDFDRLQVNALFGKAQVAMLTRAGMAPEVGRIFVSPPIKRALCQRVKGDRSWLRKVRPWFGHASHMHVRLACPAGSVGCKAQDLPPDGDGCGAELQSWFDDRSWMQRGTKPYEPETALKLEALPAECRRVLHERG